MKKVLIVDDSLFIRAMIRGILVRNGYEVIVEACDGDDAISKYKEFQPDIVTMDITMPVMGGLEALKEIVKKDASAKVVMISAMGQESYVREAIVAGAKHFIVKPFNEEHIIRTLNSLS